MKKSIFALLMMFLLTGCAAEETAETLADELLVPVMAAPARISVELPGETALPVMENDNGRVYICNDYEILVQTLPSGDLSQTIQDLSGMDRENLTVVETVTDGIRRYEFVWAAVGEKGDQTGRALVLDDNSYHYCLSVLRNTDESPKSQVNWDQVFSTFSLVTY